MKAFQSQVSINPPRITAVTLPVRYCALALAAEILIDICRRRPGSSKAVACRYCYWLTRQTDGHRTIAQMLTARKLLAFNNRQSNAGEFLHEFLYRYIIRSHMRRAKMRPLATAAACSVCWSQQSALQKRLNQSRCGLGCGLWWAQGTVY